MHDCLIVGGGVIGLSIAYELAGHGLRVRVIDRGEPGREASWAGAGILPPANCETAVHPYQQLRALSHALHPSWADALRQDCGIDNGYRRCGGIHIARSAGEAAALYGFERLLDEEGIIFQSLSPRELSRIEPGLAHLYQSGQLKAAYLLPDEAQLRNPDHLKALMASCQLRGVAITAGVEFVKFEMDQGCVSLAETSQGNIVADRYCIASGAWTYRLLKDLGLSSGIMPVRGQMVLFRCERPPLRHIVNEGPRYLVPREDGRLLVGSTEEEVGFDKRTTESGLTELKVLAAQLVPELTEERVERTWAGLRPGCYDGFPYLGKVPGLENVFVAAGHFRSGLQLSTGTAVVMSQLIRGQRPEIDLSPFRVGRG